MPQEPLSNEEVVARLDAVLKRVQELRLLVKQIQVDCGLDSEESPVVE